MTNQLNSLLSQFNHLIQAPADVDKLNATILDWAVRGKLVPQDSLDEPASVLLERIAAEKARLVAEGTIKKPKKLPPLGAEEAFFTIPANWSWSRLGTITNYGNSNKVDATSVDSGTWVLDLKDIEKSTSRLLRKERFGDVTFKSSKSIFHQGDVLYGKLRPYLDKVLVADEDGVCTTEIIPIYGYGCINPYFLRLSLKHSHFLKHIESLLYGVKMPRLGTQDAIHIPIPLPPLAEQKRIVAKVDQLHALCDELAGEAAVASTVRGRLLDAVLAVVV